MALAVTRTAVQLARQVVRHELDTRPEIVAKVAQEAVDAIVLSARHLRVRIHPADHAARAGRRRRGAEGARRAPRRRPGDRAGRLHRRLRPRPGRRPHRHPLGRRRRRVRPRRHLGRARDHRRRHRRNDAPPCTAAPEARARAGSATSPTSRTTRSCRSRSRCRARSCASPASCSRPPACACPWARCATSPARRNEPPVTAEVVGFDGDRAFLMPTGELHGLASGARVVPRAVPHLPPQFGVENHPWRRSEDRGLHLPMGAGLLGRVVDAHGRPLDRLGAAARRARRADGAPLDQRDGARPGAHAAGHRRARDQLDAHRRPRPAHRPVRRHRRRQVGAAGHDGALHAGRRDRRRADRRTRPRSQGIHRGHPRRGRPARARSSSPRRPTRRRWCACRAPTTRPPWPNTSATAASTCCC